MRLVEIRGQRGVLKAITAVQVLIEGDNESIAIANSVFLDEMICRWNRVETQDSF